MNMSLDAATPADWDRVRTAHPAIEKPSEDVVNAPSHYRATEIECIDYLEDNLGPGFEYFLEGNIKKYLHRFRHKGSQVTDLRKAQFYLNKLINRVEKED
jgi:hypothetical protein|tara:strand:+ start:435 stop:734 length:300 start_codon:yes stop_codon:yes gene_type:complete